MRGNETLQNFYSDFYLLDRRDFIEPESVSVLMVDILYSWQEQTHEIELTKNKRGNYHVKAA